MSAPFTSVSYQRRRLMQSLKIEKTTDMTIINVEYGRTERHSLADIA